jgi:hypothetical protein
MSKATFRALLIATLSTAYAAMGSPAACLAQDAVAQAESLAVPASESIAKSPLKADGLNHHQWLHLSADGSFWGTLGTPAGENQIRQSGIDIALVQNGERVAVATTADDGSFRFSDIKPGVYCLVAQNPSTLAVMSLTILDSASGKHLPAGIQVRTLTPATERAVSLGRSGSLPRLSGIQQFERDAVGEDRKFWNSGRIAIDENGGIGGRVLVPCGTTDLSNTLLYLTH